MKNRLLWKLAVGAAALSLTACGVQTTEGTETTEQISAEVSVEAPAESSTESVEETAPESETASPTADTVESSEETAAESSKEAEEETAPAESQAEFPISVLQKEVDVDGDGENEMIYLAANLMNTEYVLSVRKGNGDTIFFDDGEQEFMLEDLSLNTIPLADGKGLFYIESSLGSDWADYCIYGYNGGEIKCFGVISAYMFGMECDGSVLSTLGGMYTIQSDFVTNRYTIDWNAGTLNFIEEEHEFDVQNWNDGAFVTSSVEELTLHTEADANSETVVLKPQKVKFIKIDATNKWIYILGKDGNGGWLYQDGDWAQWQKYFADLTFFG